MRVLHNGIEYIAEYGLLGDDYILLKNVKIDNRVLNEIRFESIRDRSSFELIEGQWETPLITNLERQVKTNTQDIGYINEVFSVLAGVRE